MIRIDSIWLATEFMDMRAGTETALARVVAVFGAAQPHCAYLFANRRTNRMKVLMHDGAGVWLGAQTAIVSFYADKSVSDNTHVSATGFGDIECLVGGVDQVVD